MPRLTIGDLKRQIGKKQLSSRMVHLVGFSFFKCLLLGVLLSEMLLISLILGRNVFARSLADEGTAVVAIVCGFSLATTVTYLVLRRAPNRIIVLIRSMRFDLLVAVTFGVAISIKSGGLGYAHYEHLLAQLSANQSLLLAALPILLLLSLSIRELQLTLRSRKSAITPAFLDDGEVTASADDSLNIRDRAYKFADQILCTDGKRSIVFGVDGPWGIGKSTFLNLCIERWASQKRRQPIIYKFNPLRFARGTSFVDKFVDGLVSNIKQASFEPELRPLFSVYSQFLRGVRGSFSFLGIELTSGQYSIDDAYEDLESVLFKLDRRIIVIIDDLDRLDFESIKEVLFTLKKSFHLPNLTFIVCYDNDQINTLESNKLESEVLSTFLEKFVNLKISLFVSRASLSKFVNSDIYKFISKTSADRVLVDKAIQGLRAIFESPEYHNYMPLIGDLRKIKRFINIVLLLEIEKTDFDKSDFDFRDLTNLLLIYINFPEVFRKIYLTETDECRGYFSVVYPYEDGYPHDTSGTLEHSGEFRNSTRFTQYVKELKPSELNRNKVFLLEEVFDVKKRLSETGISSIDHRLLSSLACFNGQPGAAGGRNLEEYLKLIVNMAKPAPTGQARFYAMCLEEIHSSESIKALLSRTEFDQSRGEANHIQLWRTIINSVREFDPAISHILIEYLIDNLIRYSILPNSEIGLGLRNDLPYFLVKMLDSCGWSDEDGGHAYNTEQNIAEIADWIFGEKRHRDHGIISTFALEQRGVLGLNDLLYFRNSCCINRGGDIYNVQRALSLHHNPSAATDGDVKMLATEEMREMSQVIFQLFKQQYIATRKNIFDLIANLTLQEITGESYDFVKGAVKRGEFQDVERSIRNLQSNLVVFILYQLASKEREHGIGCGFYDTAGRSDSGEIHREMNEYLFDICFSTSDKPKNGLYLIDYIMMSFGFELSRAGNRKHAPSLGHVIKVLDEERLKSYWNNERKTVLELGLASPDRTIITPNYSATYSEYFRSIGDLLDAFVK